MPPANNVSEIFSKTDLEVLAQDLFLLESDYALALQGYQFYCALDYSELYRVMYSTLDFLRSDEDQLETFYLRQFAVRSFLEWKSVDRLLLPDTMEEVSKSLSDLESGARSAVNESTFAQFVPDKPMTEMRKLFQLLDKRIPDTVIPADMMDGAVKNVIKSTIVQNAYLKGQKILESLIRDELVKTLRKEDVAALLKSPDYNHLFMSARRKLSRRRPRRSCANASDARNITYLKLLNRRNPDTKTAYLLITSTPALLEIDARVGLLRKLPKSMYARELPLFRSLGYCLLMAYFRESTPKHWARYRRIKQTREMVESAIKVLFQDNVRNMTTQPFRASIRKLLGSLFELHAQENFRSTLNRRIQRALGISNIEDFRNTGTADLAKSLSKICENPEEVFRAYVDLELKIANARRKLHKLLSSAKVVTVIRSRHEPTYGQYSSDYYTDEERKIADYLDALFGELENPSDDPEQTMSLLQAVKEYLKLHSKSPALHIALSICLRRIGEFLRAFKALDDAARLDHTIPEIDFQRTILMRVQADHKATSKLKKWELMTEARKLASGLCGSDHALPRFCQVAAYLEWRFLDRDNLDVMATPISDKDKYLERALEYCSNGVEYLKAAGEKTQNSRIWWLLNQDYAFFLALSFEKENLEKAVEMIENIPEQRLTANGWDSKGYVYLQAFRVAPSRDKIDFLEQARQAYYKALAAGCNYSGLQRNLETCVELRIHYGSQQD